MPPLALVPNVIRAAVDWSDATDTTVTTTHFFRYSGSGPSATDAANFATVLCNAYLPNAGLWTPRTIITGAKVTDLATATGGEGSATADIPGTLDETDLAGGTAFVMNYQVSRRYRGGKPRNYYPFGATTSLSSRQAWSAGFVTAATSAVQGVFSTFVGTVEGATTITAHVNVSYYNGSTVVILPSGRARNVPTRRTTPVVDDIVGIAGSVTPGSQRRRNRG